VRGIANPEARLRSRIFALAVSAAQFGTVSVIAALVDVAVFSGLLTLFAAAPAEINPFAFSCGIATGFFLNRYWVAPAARLRPQLAKFVAANAASLVISAIAVGLMAMVMPAVAAKLLSLPITMSRSRVFKGKRLQEAHVAG
jgi:putative flippase GtrA